MKDVMGVFFVAVVAFFCGMSLGYRVGWDAAIEKAVKSGAAVRVEDGVQWKGNE